MAEQTPNTPKKAPSITVSPEQDVQKQTQQDVEHLKGPAETSAKTRESLMGLEESIALATPEKINSLDQSLATAFASMDLSRLPEDRESADGKTLQQLVIASVGLITKILHITPDVALEDPEHLFRLTLSPSIYTPLERATFQQLEKIYQNTGIHPGVNTLIFGDWRDDITKIRQKLPTPVNNTESRSITDALGTLTDKVPTLGSSMEKLGGIGVAAGLVLLTYKLIPKDDSKGVFSFGGILSLLGAGAAGLIGFSMVKDGGLRRFFDALRGFFSGKKENPENTSTSPDALPTSIETIPLKDALESYSANLGSVLAPAKRTILANQAALLAGGSILAGSHIPELLSFAAEGGKMTLGSTLALAKLGLGTVQGYPLATLFSVSALLMHKEALSPGNIQVPKNPEDLPAFLQRQVEESHEFFTRHGLPVPSMGDLGITAELLQDKEKLKEYLGNSANLVGSALSASVEEVHKTKEKLVEHKNAKGVQVFETYLSELEGNPDVSPETLSTLKALTSGLAAKKGRITHGEMEAFMDQVTDLQAGITFTKKDGYITYDIKVGHIYTVQGAALAVDPQAGKTPAEREALARDMLLTPDMAGGISALTDALVFDTIDYTVSGARKVAKALKETKDAEGLVSTILTAIWEGGQLMVVDGGKLVLTGIGYRIILGPMDILTKLPGTFTGQIQVHEYLLSYKDGVVPVMLLSLGKAGVDRLYWGKSSSLVKPIAKGLIYPLSGMWDLGKIGARAAIMKVNDVNIKSIAGDPFIGMRLKWSGLVHSIKGHGLGKASQIHDIHEDLAKLYKAQDLIQQSRGNLSIKNIGPIRGREYYITRAEELVNSTKGSGGELRKIDLRSSTVEEVYKALDEHIETNRRALGLAPRSAKNTVSQKVGKSLSEAFSELDRLSKEKIPNGPTIDAIKANIQHAQNELLKQAARIKDSTLTAAQKSALMERINEQSTKLQQKTIAAFHGAKKGFEVLGESAKNSDLAKRINSIMDDAGTGVTKIVATPGGKRAMVFAAQFGALLAVQKGVEAAGDPLYDFEKAVASIASKETLQLLVDLLPGLGFMSNFYSAAAGKEVLTGHDVSRLSSLGWGVVNLGQDLVAFVPMVGQSVRLASFGARITELLQSGKISKQAYEVLKTFPNLVGTHGKEAWTALWKGLQTGSPAIKKAVNVGTLGMTGLTVGNMILSYGQGTSVDLLPTS